METGALLRDVAKRVLDLEDRMKAEYYLITVLWSGAFDLRCDPQLSYVF